MKLNTEDSLPQGLKFSRVSSQCEGDAIDQVHNTTFNCSSCGRLFTMDILVHENKKREKEYLEEFRKAFRAALKRKLEERKKGK